MRAKGTVRLVFAEIAAVAVNVIPLSLWFFEDYSAETTMIVYAGEAAVAIVLGAVCVLLVSPSYDPDGRPKYKRKGPLLKDFIMVAGGMISLLSVFLLGFLFLIVKAEVSFRAVGAALLTVLGFQVAEFVVNTITLRPLPLRKAETLLNASMGKTALLFFGVFLGTFLAGFVNEWFVVPFVVLKLIVDIGEPIQFFLGKERLDVPFETEFSSRSG